MMRIPAAAAFSAIASTLVVLMASIAAAEALVADRSENSPHTTTDDRLQGELDSIGAEATAPGLVSGSFDLRPEVLNLKSCGKYVTGVLALPDGRSVRDVSIPSVRLNGVVYAITSFGPHNPVVQFENKETLMLKFEKDAVMEILSPGTSILIWVEGSFTNGARFVAEGDSVIVA
jgi:hypothetical protein